MRTEWKRRRPQAGSGNTPLVSGGSILSAGQQGPAGEPSGFGIRAPVHRALLWKEALPSVLIAYPESYLSYSTPVATNVQFRTYWSKKCKELWLLRSQLKQNSLISMRKIIMQEALYWSVFILFYFSASFKPRNACPKPLVLFLK